MSNYQEIAPRQDMPPPDGFPKIQFQRHLPKRGPAGWMLFSGLALITAYGFYTAKKGIDIRWETDRETKQAELHLQPFLEAEKDRMVIRALHESRRYEEFLMKDRPDWKVNEGSKIFHTRKYVPEHMMAHPDSEIFKFPIFRECSKLFN